MLFAKAPAGQVFEIRLDTKFNALNFRGESSTTRLTSELHYGKYL